MTRIIFILFFYQSVFSQNEKDQIEMETTTLMNVPMMGTITTSVKSYASDKSFKKDNNKYFLGLSNIFLPEFSSKIFPLSKTNTL